jgi:cysteine desulfurase/selenocysteine lyase
MASLQNLGRHAIEQHETALTEYALARLFEVRGLQLIGPRTAADRIPVFSFTLAGWSAQEILQRLDAQGIAVRAGDLASLPLFKRFGVTGAARASCHIYSSTADIDRLIGALQRLRR